MPEARYSSSPRLPQRLQHFLRAGHRHFLAGNASAAHTFHAVSHLLPQQIVVLVFVLQRFSRRAAPRPDFLGQLDHLIDRLLAVESHHVFFHVLKQFLAGFPRAGGLQDVDHHRDHHILPVAAQQGDGSVEVKDGRAKSAAGKIGRDDFDGAGRVRHG